MIAFRCGKCSEARCRIRLSPRIDAINSSIVSSASVKPSKFISVLSFIVPHSSDASDHRTSTRNPKTTKVRQKRRTLIKTRSGEKFKIPVCKARTPYTRWVRRPAMSTFRSKTAWSLSRLRCSRWGSKGSSIVQNTELNFYRKANNASDLTFESKPSAVRSNLRFCPQFKIHHRPLQNNTFYRQRTKEAQFPSNFGISHHFATRSTAIQLHRRIFKTSKDRNRPPQIKINHILK